MINHGKSILKEMRRNTLWGKVKSKISWAFWWVVYGGAVSCFVGAGIISGNALVGFN